MVAGAEAEALDITKEKLPVETVTKIDARDVGTPDDWVPPPPSPGLSTTSFTTPLQHPHQPMSPMNSCYLSLLQPIQLSTNLSKEQYLD